MDVSTKKPKKNPDAAAAAPTPPPPPQLIVRVRQADGTVRRVAFDDGAASLDDLRAESGADELFADEACTQPCTAADLVHGVSSTHDTMRRRKRRRATPWRTGRRARFLRLL